MLVTSNTTNNHLLPRAIVLAGGASSRFGTDKAVVDIGGQTLTAFIVKELLKLFQRVLIVAKSPELLGVAASDRVYLLREDSSSRATLLGICTGLQHSDRMLNYIVGCDMPGIVPEVIRELYRLSRNHDAALRQDAEGEWHPLGGFYTKRALPLLQRQLAAGNYRLRSILPSLQIASLPIERLRALDANMRSFWNINTPEDLHSILNGLNTIETAANNK